MILDTSIVVDIIRGRRKYQYAAVSTISVLEIVRGFETEIRMVEGMNFMKRMFYIHEMDDEVILSYAKLYQELKRSKQTMADADLIIAATAHAKGETLYTKDNDFNPLINIVDIKKE